MEGFFFKFHTRSNTADMGKHTNTLPLQFATNHSTSDRKKVSPAQKPHNEHSLSMALLGVTRRHARYYYHAERWGLQMSPRRTNFGVCKNGAVHSPDRKDNGESVRFYGHGSAIASLPSGRFLSNRSCTIARTITVLCATSFVL